jgi:hypothetical protein
MKQKINSTKEIYKYMEIKQNIFSQWYREENIRRIRAQHGTN